METTIKVNDDIICKLVDNKILNIEALSKNNLDLKKCLENFTLENFSTVNIINLSQEILDLDLFPKTKIFIFECCNFGKILRSNNNKIYFTLEKFSKGSYKFLFDFLKTNKKVDTCFKNCRFNFQDFNNIGEHNEFEIFSIHSCKFTFTISFLKFHGYLDENLNKKIENDLFICEHLGIDYDFLSNNEIFIIDDE